MLIDDLPDYIDREAWDGWLEARKKIKKPATDRAKKLALKKLAEFRAEGHCPNEILDQSTLNSWQDLYPIRGKKPQEMDTTEAWGTLRACIRDGRAPADPVLASVAQKLGGIGRLGEKSSQSIDMMRGDFNQLYRQARAH